jgi:hypothetical protein
MQWQAAIDLLPSCRKKDVTILKLYFTCLDRIEGLNVNDDSFLFRVQDYMSQSPLPHCLEPELFNLSRANCERVRLLLLVLQQNQVVDSSISTAWVETLTNILFEVLQFVGIIPSDKTEKLEKLEELKSVAEAFEGIRNNLIDFRNLI